MANEHDSNDPAANSQGEPLPQPPVIPPAPLQRTLSNDSKGHANEEQNETKELGREFRIAEKWVIGTNIALAIIGVVALCIYNGQLRVMRGQLGEIIKQYPELQKSADAAKTAAEIAELSERPWIKIVGIKTRGNNPIIPALSVQGFGHGPFPNGARQVTFQIAVTLKNIGHSVADITVDHELFLPLWKDYFASIMAEGKSFCDKSWHIKSESPAKAVLFPDDAPFTWYGGAVALVTEDHINHFSGGDPAGYIIPTVIRRKRCTRRVPCLKYSEATTEPDFSTLAEM